MLFGGAHALPPGCRTATFDGEEASAEAVEKALAQGVFTRCLDALNKALLN
jgi:hypothetical protein